jgi:ubiquinone/menaquinone biosynthesis C-methylase UbiE
LPDGIHTKRSPFDAAAAGYDGAFSSLPAVRALRARIYALFLPHLPPGAIVVDYGCGTGEDVIALAERGFYVFGCDPSGAMLAIASDKIRRGNVHAACVRCADLTAVKDASCDMVLSNFGAMNCLHDQAAAIAECHRVLRPRGILAVVLIGKHSLWETAAFLLRGRVRRAFRRWKVGIVPVRVAGWPVETRLVSVPAYRRMSRGKFEVLSTTGLNVFTPPPGSTSVRRMRPGFWGRAEVFERHVQSLPVVRAMGDHVAFILRKRDSAVPKKPVP